MTKINFVNTIYDGTQNTDYKELQKKEPDTLFIFNDNTSRIGKGNNACIRGKHNAFGVATGINGNNKKGIYIYQGFGQNKKYGLNSKDDVGIEKNKLIKNIIDDDFDKIYNAVIKNKDSEGNKRKNKYNTIRYSGEKNKELELSFNLFSPTNEVRNYISEKLKDLHKKLNNNKKIKSNVLQTKKSDKIKSPNRNIFTKHNFKFIDVQADGNCLFHALFKTLVDDMSNEERDFNDGNDLRLYIVDYIRKNSEFFIPQIEFFLQNEILLKAKDQKNTKKVEKIENILSKSDNEDEILKYYTDWMEKSYTYGGNLEIIAFRRMSNVNVRVYTISNGKLDFSTPSGDYDPSLKTVNLFHHGDFEHYSALLPIIKKTNTNNDTLPNKKNSKKQPNKKNSKKQPNKKNSKKQPNKNSNIQAIYNKLNKLLKTVDLKLDNYKKRSNYHLKKNGKIPEKYIRKTKRHQKLKQEIINFINDKQFPSKETTTKFENKLKNIDIDIDIEKEIVKKTDDTELEKKLGKILKKCNDKLENYKKRENYYQKIKKEFPKIKYTRKTKRYQSIKDKIINIKRNKTKITKKLIDDLTKNLMKKKDK